MIKLLHTGDIHANKTRAKDIVKLINIYIEEIKTKSIDAVLFCGDFWDCAVVNNTSFSKIVAAMSRLISLVPVYMIYGTPFHEISNSLEIFKELGANVTAEPKLWTFSKGEETINILGVPEPRRSDFIASSVEETNRLINKYLEKSFNVKSDYPTIVMFHGEVSGSHLQNGVKSKSDTQLTKKMYSQCNPVYIAAAHIHEPQTIDRIVHYCGSAIPCNFGELHSPQYSLVTVNNSKASFQEVKLPFSQNRVVECDFNLYSRLKDLNFKGLNVKITLSLTPEQRKLFRVKDEAKKLQSATNADNVTITISTTKEVSIRSKEIIKTTSLHDKLVIYSKVNNIKLTDSIINKAKEIEDNLLIKYSYPTHSFELLSLSLRGAKGLTGREEINIDFTDYQDGVIALVGRNGVGKSTLLENMSPYPRLLTRSGALRSHFYLKDSHRIVTYRDENNIYYRFTIQLAAHIDTGLVKYYAETSEDEGLTWKKVDSVDGNVDVYTDYVNNLFGSVELYLRTAFFTKGKVKGVNDIASATKGERIQLISELLGSDTLSDMHNLIKDKLKVISNEMDKYENIEEKQSECETQISNKQTNLSRIKIELNDIEEKLCSIEKEVLETKSAEEEFNKNYAKYGNAILIKSECENRIAELTEQLDKLTEHKKNNDFYKLHSKQIQKYKEAYEEAKPLSDKIVTLTKELNTSSSNLAQLAEEYNNAKSMADIEQRKYDSIDDRIKHAEGNLLCIDENCPTCGAKLSEKKRKELAKANEYVQSEIESLKEFKVNQKLIAADTKKKLANIKSKYEKAKETDKQLQEQYTQLDGLYQVSHAYLDMNEEYLPYIDYVLVTNLESDIEKISSELDKTKSMLETLSGVDLVDYKAKLEELEIERKSYEQDKLSKSMDLATINAQIEQLEETLSTIKEQSELMKRLAKEFEEYSILEQAFSNSGIQALELEAAVPSIAELTNQILHDSYGDKFSIAFSTLKQGRNKIIDDFSIDVTNNETGWTTPIELLSEGEKIWVIQSLYFAFSIVRMERTGFSFAVRFIDESDGALDSEARLKYLSMINSVHKSGNSKKTILITHSQELKDIVQQSIQL